METEHNDSVGDEHIGANVGMPSVVGGPKAGSCDSIVGWRISRVGSREIRVPIYQLEEWRDKAIAGMESALRLLKDDPVERKLAEAQRPIGEITMENELPQERCRRGGSPFARGYRPSQ